MAMPKKEKTAVQEFLGDAAFDALSEKLRRKGGAGFPVAGSEVCEALGRVNMAFQKIEFEMRCFIWMLAGINNDQPTAQILTADHSYGKLCSALLALANHKNISQKGILEKVIRKAAKAEEVRNGLTHSVWMPEFRLKTSIKKGKLSHHFETHTAAELGAVAEKMLTISGCLSAIMLQHMLDEAIAAHPELATLKITS